MKIGVDEVGYGAWAGPVFACAVQFTKIPTVRFFDSKKISEKKRIMLFAEVEKVAKWQIGTASVEEVNEKGLAYAHKMAILRSLEGMKGDIIIDGRKPAYLECTAVINGDSLIQEIAAASIMAKVLRDKLMNELSEQFPQYSWEKNKGYGTQAHIDAIKQHGLCAMHRSCYKLDKYL